MTKVCKVCGKSFETNYSNGKYCSLECRRIADSILAKQKYLKHHKDVCFTKECSICGKEFNTTHFNAKYCSEACRKLGKKKYRIEYKKKNIEKVRAQKRAYYRAHKDQIRKYQEEHREEIRRNRRNYYLSHKNKHKKERHSIINSDDIRLCSEAHDNCFSCPTVNGECLYD